MTWTLTNPFQWIFNRKSHWGNAIENVSNCMLFHPGLDVFTAGRVVFEQALDVSLVSGCGRQPYTARSISPLGEPVLRPIMHCYTVLAWWHWDCLVGCETPSVTLPVIHSSTKFPLAGASAFCCYAQSNILSKMATMRGQASEWCWPGAQPQIFPLPYR